MKKLNFYLLVFGISILFTNCSTENDDTFNEKINEKDLIQNLNMRTSNLEDLKIEYKKFLMSKEYRDFINSSNNLSQNLGLENEKLFKDKEELLLWLKSNIDLTNFLSLNQAIESMNTTTTFYEISMKKNSILFNKIAELDENQQFEIYSTITSDNSYTNVTNSGPCENECINDGVDCGRAADEAYAGAMLVSNGLWATGNVLAAGTVAVIASINHSTAQRSCARGFNACMRGCGW